MNYDFGDPMGFGRSNQKKDDSFEDDGERLTVSVLNLTTMKQHKFQDVVNTQMMVGATSILNMTYADGSVVTYFPTPGDAVTVNQDVPPRDQRQKGN